MNRLDRYLIRNFVLGIIPALFLLLALFSLLALSEALEDVGRGNFSQIDALLVVLATLPRRMIDLLPVSVLIGGLMGLGAMANHQELIAARMAGMSRWRLARPIIILSVVLSGLMVLLQSVVVPLAEQEAAELRAGALDQTDITGEGAFQFWARSDNQFVQVGNVLFNQLLSGVEIYKTDEKGKLTELVHARQARVLGNRNWMLEDVTVTGMSQLNGEEKTYKTLEWPLLLTDEQTEILMLPIDALSFRELRRYISYLSENKLDTHHYRVVFWQQVSPLVALLGMALLALPLLIGSTRILPASQRVVLGGVIGIGFYLLQQLTGHLATLFTLNPPLTIMTPAVLLLVVSILALSHKRAG
jgi:lipopolysaccharide export system permease protein